MKTYSLLLIAALFAACGTTDSPSEPTGKPVDDKSFVTLGGEEQYVEITSSSDKNPVMLFIHGGPGWPQTPQIRAFNSDIAKSYTLVVWEQRGAGLSYGKNPNPANLTLQQIVSDAKELTEQLKSRFKKEKIYLAGYSWGSVVGMKLAQAYPDDYHAYISIAQVVSMKRGMEISQKWLAVQAEKANDRESLATLAKLKNPDREFCADDFECFLKQYELILKYGGAVFDKDIDKKIETATAKYDDYKDYDWIKVWQASADRLKGDMMNEDFSNVDELKLPVYFFVGRHDHNVPSELVVELANRLKAPKKEVIWLEKAGHAIMEEEPETFNRLVVEKVLGLVNGER